MVLTCLCSLLQDASDEYFGAEIEVLADAKKDIPPSSSAGALISASMLYPAGVIACMAPLTDTCCCWSRSRVQRSSSLLAAAGAVHLSLMEIKQTWAAPGLALKQLTDNEGRPYHANIRHNKRREKGKWLAETVKETMTSISMNEDLYDSDDEMPPPSALRKRARKSAVSLLLHLLVVGFHGQRGICAEVPS